MRYFFQIGYDGSHYHGWQSQHNANSIQDEVESPLQKITSKKTAIVGSSRTDTGVHCIKQFFHVDLDDKWDGNLIMHKLNIMLPKDIAIHAVKKVKPNAHARYSATRRCYEYRITRKKNPFLRHYAYPYFRQLDIATMNKTAESLIGSHNFEAFSKVKTQVNNFMCTLYHMQWKEKGDLLLFTITANRFLRGMVRALVGSLLDIGKGKIRAQDFRKTMSSKDRREAGASVPPQGLYLTDVAYPKHIFIH